MLTVVIGLWRNWPVRFLDKPALYWGSVALAALEGTLEIMGLFLLLVH